MDTLDDFSTLQQDASLSEPLRRVAYEAGMMLGLEATRDEQAYHRRRLSRQQYWLHGYGTLAGMAVSSQIGPPPTGSLTPVIRLLVSPGMGIDGLGREVLINEHYCVSLGDWLLAQSVSDLSEGYDDDQNQLWLKVCVRQKDCPVAQQPVLARKLNLSTDAVQPSRTSDSVRLELIPELPPAQAAEAFAPWAVHPPVADALPTLLAAEQALLQDVQTNSPQDAPQLELHARLLHALDNSGVDPGLMAEELEAGARLLLARIRLSIADLTAIDLAALAADATAISINNLVRPFLVTASQLAWLARQP
ncbi:MULTISPECIES: hypothetical protein [Methylomonas]|uniref:hypothetical protein n=1 Tax=Methylomonas TaxID=416 RepID=UPI0012323C29|nr:hypothetical protein [Methylomonas rhizoryzae]